MSFKNEIKVKEFFVINEELVTIADEIQKPYLDIDFERSKLYASDHGKLYYLGEKQNTNINVNTDLIAYGEAGDDELFDGDIVSFIKNYENAMEKFYLLVPNIKSDKMYMLIRVIEDEVIIIENKFYK